MNGLPNGNGTYIWRNGRTYKGEFSNGLRHGKGAQTWIDGSSYVGSWAHDQPDGWGSHYIGNGKCLYIYILDTSFWLLFNIFHDDCSFLTIACLAPDP